MTEKSQPMVTINPTNQLNGNRLNKDTYIQQSTNWNVNPYISNQN